jgi:hypothetical protein
MKRRIAAKNTRIPPVRFHFEDLSELVDIFKRYCETVEISDDKAIYESLSEAAKNAPSSITNLEIAGKNPAVILSLKSTGSWLAQRFEKPEMQDAELDRYRFPGCLGSDIRLACRSQDGLQQYRQRIFETERHCHHLLEPK